jgi:hypothetical protein
MNGLYNMLLFLFILGAVSQGFNELGVFQTPLYANGATISNGQTVVTNLQDSAVASPDMTSIILSFMRVLGMGITAMFTIIPMMMHYMNMLGVPTAVGLVISGIVQAPATFVTVTGFMEWWTGRSLT